MGKFNQRKIFKKDKDQKEETTNEKRCFECKKLRTDYPLLKKNARKGKKERKKKQSRICSHTSMT